MRAGTLTALAGALLLTTAGAASFRPQYHFSAARNWINDPNGLVFIDGTYHLFYQYNPFGERWGHMSWGHAVSTDLLHWQERSVAIPEDPMYMIFSGSIVVDAGNSSGFAAPGGAPLVAVYTGARRDSTEIQSQQLAFSSDQGRTWSKYSANPVLDLGLRAFRDPKVFWYEPHQEWIMVAVMSDVHRVTFYRSTDLKAWVHAGDFGPAGAADGAWECPDLFALPVINAPGEVRWVLKVDVFRSKTAGGSGAQYFVGDFDGGTFVEAGKSGGQVVDYGRDFYAAASWANVPAIEGRHLWVAWMNNHDYASDIPTAPFRGTMSVPREVSLRRTNGGYELLQSPVSELAALRRRHRRLVNLPIAQEPRKTVIAQALGPAAEMEITLNAGEAEEFGVELRAGPHEMTVIGYDVKSQRLFLDRTRSGRVDFNPLFPGRQWAPLVLARATLRLHLLLDSSSIEVFAGDGERVFTEQIFPGDDSLAVRAYARGGTARVQSGDLWDLARR